MISNKQNSNTTILQLRVWRLITVIHYSHNELKLNDIIWYKYLPNISRNV